MITPIRLSQCSMKLPGQQSIQNPCIVQLTKQPNCQRYTNMLATDAWIIIRGRRWRELAAQKQKMRQIQIQVVVVAVAPLKMLHAARVESEIRRRL